MLVRRAGMVAGTEQGEPDIVADSGRAPLVFRTAGMNWALVSIFGGATSGLGCSCTRISCGTVSFAAIAGITADGSLCASVCF